ncbi:MAG: allophanate hydrolase [Fibrobacteria bacterium]|nr:allophanate hydrolase [Fibrobacteria bacterium]
MPHPSHPGTDLRAWQEAYRSGSLSPEDLREILATDAHDTAWITPPDPVRIGRELDLLASRLAEVGGDPGELPLYGIPFAVKDNIDAVGWPTTAGCAAFSYEPDRDAPVVARLRRAGAIVAGKTNLDQFATGLVGTRSPFGVVPNPHDARIVSGGSSSGSAVVVARGTVPFSLGTDTAGSGRVPAGLNGIVGLKPTRGRFSTSGVVPACRSLDCVSLFARSVSDAEFLAGLLEGFEESDPWSRKPDLSAPTGPSPSFRVGVPSILEFHGDETAKKAFDHALEHARSIGATLVPVEWAPFAELAGLLYQGPWVSERMVVLEELLATDPGAVHPVVRGIVEKASAFDAVDTFRAEYRRVELAREIQVSLSHLDALIVPTAPIAPTIEEVLDDPFGPNTRLGTYTNFANLADLCAISVPSAPRADGIPFGVTFLAPAWHDHALARIARRWEGGADETPVRSSTLRIAVLGAHLSGLPLCHQLTERGASLVETTATASDYRFFALPGSHPRKPGLRRCLPGEQGASIQVELWDLPIGQVGSFLGLVPAPLGIGTLELIDGRSVKGFLCESHALEQAEDITSHGGWRAYLASSLGEP